MQFEGGYRYPSSSIILVLSLVSAATAVAVYYLGSVSPLKGVALFLGLEGTALLASAYSPVGLVPPQGSLWSRFTSLLRKQKGTAVCFEPLPFYGGLFCLFVAMVLSALHS